MDAESSDASRKRELEADEKEERRAKHSDCIMVFADDKSQLDDVEMLSLQLKSQCWLQCSDLLVNSFCSGVVS